MKKVREEIEMERPDCERYNLGAYRCKHSIVI
jgi:hypothetical protein